MADDTVYTVITRLDTNTGGSTSSFYEKDGVVTTTGPSTPDDTAYTVADGLQGSGGTPTSSFYEKGNVYQQLPLDTNAATAAAASAAASAASAAASAASFASYALTTYVDAADALKAPLASPTFTGSPKAPTPANADNSNNIATTAWVQLNAPGTPPATVAPLMDGVAAVGVATKYAREDHKHPTDTSLATVASLAAYALLASPTFSGTPSAPTRTALNNSTALATTAYVDLTTREKLSANRTYFVLTTGSDSNTGQVNNAGGAFLTIQKAINVVAALDINIFNVTIQVGAGTYTAGAAFNGAWLGSGTVTLTGDTTTPSNVVISTGATSCISVSGCQVTIQGFKLTSSGQFLLTASSNAVVKIGGAMDWGAYSFGGLNISSTSYVSNLAAACTISGAGSGVFLSVGTGGKFDNLVATTWTVAAGAAITVTFFAFADSDGYINCNGMTFPLGSGASVTGTRFSVRNGAYINTGGGGANYFPGTVAGAGTNFSAAPWGLYL